MPIRRANRAIAVNSRPTVLRGLMTDEEWAIFAPLLTTPCSRGERPPKEPSAQIGWHTLDLPDRSAVARRAGGVRQMELRVQAIPPLVRVWRLGPLASGAG